VLNLAFQLTINGLIAGAIYSLVVLGFALQYRVAKFFDFGYAAVFAISAYCCWAFINALNLHPSSITSFSFIVSALVGIFAGAILAALLQIFIYGPLRRHHASSLVLLIASLGVFVTLQNAISLFVGDGVKVIRPGSITLGYPVTIPGLGTARLTSTQLGAVVTSALIGVVITLFLKHSRQGKILRALANDSELARAVGINSEVVHTSVHAVAGGLSAVAAIWMALDTDLVPLMGFRVLVIATAAMVIGGIGSIPGAILGAMMIGVVQNLGSIQIEAKWQDTVTFVLLLCFLVLRPQGILGSRLRAAT
jgi:branched-chain amino acid transport system permease protein